MQYLIHLIQIAGYFGYAILFLTLVLESIPFTFFLPGDSLLFTTGFLASQGHFNLALLCGVLFVASVVGYLVSYTVGKKFRGYILNHGDTFWFKRKHLETTQKFFEKYGRKTIIIGRFVPVVRSFGPTLAGTGEMNYKEFVRDSIIGGFLWAVGLTTIGYYLGRAIPGAHLYLTPIIVIIILVSLVPVAFEYFRSRREKKANAS